MSDDGGARAAIEQRVTEKVAAIRFARAGESGNGSPPDVKTVHELRVATRRIKAAMDLAETVVPEKPRRKFVRSLRRLRRTLGPLRDADVMLQHLEEFKREDRFANAAAWLMRRLREQRDQLARDALKELGSGKRSTPDEAWRELRTEVRQAESALQYRAVGVIAEQLASFTAQATSLRRARSTEPHGAGPDVHALRIAGKLLRYTLELAEPIDHTAATRVLKSFKRLQDALGLWHDYVVLGETLMRGALRDELPLHQAQLYGDVLMLAHRLWERSEEELSTFSQLWSDDGNPLSQRIVEAFGTTAERQMT